MLSKLKFNPRDLLVGLIILTPVFVLSYFVYNPEEQNAKKIDSYNKENINLIARALEPYFKKEGVYPQSLSPDAFLSYTPANLNYNYLVSIDRKSMVIYTAAKSLAWKEYCPESVSQILFSSEENRTDIVCGETPASGKQRFER